MECSEGARLQEVSESELLYAYLDERPLTRIDDARIDEITVCKYAITSQVTDSTTWADGEIILCEKWRKIWAPEGTKVKFRILDQRYSLATERKELFKKVDELIALKGYSNVITPIFATYNVLLKRTIICYPFFDKTLTDWLTVNKISTADCMLPALWRNLIKTMMSIVIPVKKLRVGRFEDQTSYVMDQSSSTQPKIILFPLEDKGNHYFSFFGTFLHQYLYNSWQDPELKSFIDMLQRLPDDLSSLEQIALHPLMEDLDSISTLIRNTWRATNVLTSLQRKTIDSIIFPRKWGGANSWKASLKYDIVLADMLRQKNYTDDVDGLFAFVKEICAHYTQRHRKLALWRGQHPIVVVKWYFPGLISDIYKLHQDPNWLK